MMDMPAILDIIDKTYPEANISLDFSNPLELLVATVLSAQCTDERVNQVTKKLFKKYRTAADYANAPPGELEEDIRSTGFFRNKAKSLKNCGAALVEKHQAEVPDSLEELVKLPGIGRKTANVILQQRDPVKIEFDLMELIPQEKWTLFSHQLIQHGRKVCKARKPKCTECPLLEHCDHGQLTAGS
jgi:endonuclease-3